MEETAVFHRNFECPELGLLVQHVEIPTVLLLRLRLWLLGSRP